MSPQSNADVDAALTASEIAFFLWRYFAWAVLFCSWRASPSLLGHFLADVGGLGVGGATEGTDDRRLAPPPRLGGGVYGSG